MAAEYSSFLKNKIWVLRHGRSIPNAKGIIISSLENGILEEYRLCPDGIQQARLAGESFLKEIKKRNIGIEHICICYSPFSRTSHTAKVVASVLNVPFDGPQCEAMEDLRERFFGCSFELMSHDKYPEIWAMDEEDPFTRPEGGESVADVVTRLTRALTKMESAFEDCMVLVVSHGDPLQILQTIINAAVQTRRTGANDLTSRIQETIEPFQVDYLNSPSNDYEFGRMILHLVELVETVGSVRPRTYAEIMPFSCDCILKMVNEEFH